VGGIKGDLRVMPLSDLAIWLANRGLSGTLEVARQTNRIVFDIEDGMVARASSNNPRHYFGQFLVHFGLLTEDQLQRAFETQDETEVLLGRILVMIGIVPEEQVIQTLRVKFAENLLGAMRWTDGTFNFEEGRTRIKNRPRIEVAVPLVDIHAEALVRAQTWESFQRLIPSRMVMFGVNAHKAGKRRRDELDTRIIGLAQQGLSVEAITLELHATDYQVAVRLVALVQQGLLYPREPSVQVEAPELTADLPQSHADKAMDAIANRQFTAAFRHVQAGAKNEPDNPQFQALRSELEKRSAESSATLLSKDAVPKLTDPLDPMQTRRMTAKQRYLLARIDGKRSVQSIIQVSPMHDFEAMDILQQFCDDEVVDVSG